MRDFLIKSAKEIGVDLSEKQLDQFLNYYEILIEWNNKMNLTAITQPNDAITKHFVDSLVGLPYIKKGASVIDIGSGAGFPGVPFAIVREDIDILLMDSLNKRIRFLNEVIKNLQLTNIRAVHARAEEQAHKQIRESFDVVVARAVAQLRILCEYCLPYVQVDGLFLAYKGSDIDQEMSEAKKTIELLGGEIQDKKMYELPFSDIHHSLILIKKVRQTPVKYPRNYGKITKLPIR